MNPTLLLTLAAIGLGLYFLWRRGRGADQPTVLQDIRNLFRFSAVEGDREGFARHTPASQVRRDLRDHRIHAMEHDPELTDEERAAQIRALKELLAKDVDEADSKEKES